MLYRNATPSTSNYPAGEPKGPPQHLSHQLKLFWMALQSYIHSPVPPIQPDFSLLFNIHLLFQSGLSLHILWFSSSWAFNKGLEFIQSFIFIFFQTQLPPRDHMFLWEYRLHAKKDEILTFICHLQVKNYYYTYPSKITIIDSFHYTHFSTEDAKVLRNKVICQGCSFVKGQHFSLQFCISKPQWSSHSAIPPSSYPPLSLMTFQITH